MCESQSAMIWPLGKRVYVQVVGFLLLRSRRRTKYGVMREDSKPVESVTGKETGSDPVLTE